MVILANSSNKVLASSNKLYLKVGFNNQVTQAQVTNSNNKEGMVNNNSKGYNPLVALDKAFLKESVKGYNQEDLDIVKEHHQEDLVKVYNQEDMDKEHHQEDIVLVHLEDMDKEHHPEDMVLVHLEDMDRANQWDKQ